MYVLDPEAVGHSAVQVTTGLALESTDAETGEAQPGAFGILGVPGCPPVVVAENHARPCSCDFGSPDDTTVHRCYVQTRDTTGR